MDKTKAKTMTTHHNTAFSQMPLLRITIPYYTRISLVKSLDRLFLFRFVIIFMNVISVIYINCDTATSLISCILAVLSAVAIDMVEKQPFSVNFNKCLVIISWNLIAFVFVCGQFLKTMIEGIWIKHSWTLFTAGVGAAVLYPYQMSASALLKLRKTRLGHIACVQDPRACCELIEGFTFA